MAYQIVSDSGEVTTRDNLGDLGAIQISEQILDVTKTGIFANSFVVPSHYMNAATMVAGVDHHSFDVRLIETAHRVTPLPGNRRTPPRVHTGLKVQQQKFTFHDFRPVSRTWTCS